MKAIVSTVMSQKKPLSMWHQLTSMTSMSMKMCPWHASENTWLSLGWNTRIQNGWRTAHGCCDSLTEWNVVNYGGNEKAWSQKLQHHYTMPHVLLVWEACLTPPGMWVTSCGLWNNQEESQFSHKGLGWWGEGHPSSAYDVWGCWCSEARWAGSWGLVCGRPRAEHIGWCQFFIKQSSIGEAWNKTGGHLLAVT